MDRSRFVRALALTIGVAGSMGWQADWTLAGQCDNCDSPASHRCQCPPGRGLLDTLNDVACRVVKDQPKRKSILHAFKLDVKVSASCDKASCGCEPACGVEPSCGAEPTCGTENSCGVEASCGVEPSCGIEPKCGCEPSCGVEPKCGVEASCGIDAKQGYTHATGPIHYPEHVQPRAVAPQPVQKQAPAPHNQIPAPVPEDSTVDPFRDDAAVGHARPRSRSASQRISSHTPAATERSLHFDPQAARNVGPQRAIVKRSSATQPQAHGRVSDPLPTIKSSEVEILSANKTSRNVDSKVLPASASEPAKLPPLKSAQEPFDLSSSRNPLRD